MLDDDAWQWFLDHGGLTRANGDRFGRSLVLSRGNTQDLAAMYKTWLGDEPSIEPMLKRRGSERPCDQLSCAPSFRDEPNAYTLFF